MNNFLFLLIIMCLSTAFSLIGDSFAEEMFQKCTQSHPEIYIPNCIHVSVKNLEEIFPDPLSFKDDADQIIDFDNMMREKNLQYSDKIPHNWWTGITIHSIDNIDLTQKTYDMKFSFWIEIFEKNDPTNFLKNPPEVDFVNAVSSLAIEPSKGTIPTKHYYDVLVSGTFHTDMDVRQFPLEQLDLKIIIEPTSNYVDGSGTDRIQFHMWPSAALLPVTPSPGYEIVSYDITIGDHQYSNSEYPRFEASFEVNRYFFGSFLKYLLPIIVMISLSAVTLLYPGEQFLSKIELNAVFLLGMIFFIQAVIVDIPTSDFNLFNIVMIISFVTIILTMVIPALKWRKLRGFEYTKQFKKEWGDADKKNNDLNMENLSIVDSDIVFFQNKLKNLHGNTPEYLRLKNVIEHLHDKRLLLNQLQSTDMQISRLARKRADFTVSKISDYEIQSYIRAQSDYYIETTKIPQEEFENINYNDKEIKIKKILSKKDFKSVINKFFRSETIFNPRDICYMIMKLSEKKNRKHLTSEQQSYVYDIAKQLDQYVQTKNSKWTNKYGRSRAELASLYYIWKKYGYSIKKEIMLKIHQEGSFDQIIDLQDNRKEIVKRLQKIEIETEDHNFQMPNYEGTKLDSNIIHILSKNEVDELLNLNHTYRRLNWIAYCSIGGMIVAGTLIISLLFI